jgi:ornithine cyclodeaminase
MMLLFSAETGEPLAFLADSGHLTDVRTAAVAAMTARELGRRDRAIGILGAGIQAHLSAVFHHQFLRPDLIVLWARSRDRAEALAHQIRALTPAPHVEIAPSAADLARTCRLILTCTAARHPLLRDPDIQPGTHISAIGSDSPGKQELDPVLLRRATLLLADSLPQCAALGELQHAPDLRDRAIDIGDFCLHPRPVPPEALTIADFTGIGVEDLYIAQSVYERLAPTA